MNGDHFVTGSSTAAAVTGYPSIAVPAGFAYGELPVGISFIGRAWDEPKLIKLTSGFEAGTKVRHAPRFLHSLGLKDFVPRGSSMRAGAAAAGAGSVTATTSTREIPRAWPI